MGNNHSGNSNFESAIDYNKLMKRIFDATQTGGADFLTAESMRASSQQEKWSLEGIQKQKEDEDKKADALNEVAEFTAQLREEQERRQQEAYWSDRVVSFDGHDLKGREWRALYNIMMTEEFRKQMREQGKRKGYSEKQMDEAEILVPKIADKLARGEQPTAEEKAALTNNPAAQDFMNEGLKDWQIGLNSKKESAANLSQGDNAIDARATAFESDSNIAGLTPSSVSKGMDGNATNADKLSNAFNDVAAISVQTPTVAADKNITVAANAGFNLNNGML